MGHRSQLDMGVLIMDETAVNVDSFISLLEKEPRLVLREESLVQVLDHAVTPRTLRDWRGQGIGPKHIHLTGKIVAYPVADLLEWLRSQPRFQSTTEYQQFLGVL